MLLGYLGHIAYRIWGSQNFDYQPLRDSDEVLGLAFVSSLSWIMWINFVYHVTTVNKNISLKTYWIFFGFGVVFGLMYQSALQHGASGALQVGVNGLIGTVGVLCIILIVMKFMLLKHALHRALRGCKDSMLVFFKVIYHLGRALIVDEDAKGPDMNKNDILLAVCLLFVVIIPGIFGGWLIKWEIGAYFWGKPLWWWLTLGAVVLKPSSEPEETWKDDAEESCVAIGCSNTLGATMKQNIMGKNGYEWTRDSAEAVATMMVGFALPDVVVTCLYPWFNTYSVFPETKK
jgi:hypothetical protein